MKLKKFLLKHYGWLKKKWDNIPFEKKSLIFFILNYGIAAFPLAFAMHSFLFGYYKNFFVFFVDIWIMIMYFEHYYVWLREGWKHQKNQ